MSEDQLSKDELEVLLNLDPTDTVAKVEAAVEPLLSDPCVSMSPRQAVRLGAYVALTSYRQIKTLVMAKAGAPFVKGRKIASENRTAKKEQDRIKYCGILDVKWAAKKPRETYNSICKRIAHDEDVDDITIKRHTRKHALTNGMIKIRKKR
jgi:hypothetical protein